MVSLFVAIRDGILTWSGFQDAFSGIEALGLGSLEIAVLRKEAPGKPEILTALGFELSGEVGIEALMGALRKRGISVCALLLDNDFAKEDLDREVDYIVRACRIAHKLGAKAVRINAVMRETQGLSLLDYHRRTLKGVRACLKEAEGLGVSLAIENHGLIANRCGFLFRLLEEVESDWLGLTLDTGNFYWYGYPLEEIYDIVYGLAPYVRHTHIKNGRAQEDRRDRKRKPRDVTMAPLYEGDIDLKVVVETLKDAGYDHDLTIEDESLGSFPVEERRRILAKDVDYMRGLLP